MRHSGIRNSNAADLAEHSQLLPFASQVVHKYDVPDTEEGANRQEGAAHSRVGFAIQD